MNYLKHLNQENIDTWNKDNPEQQFSYEDCANGLKENVDHAVGSIIDSLLQKYYDGKLSVDCEYIFEGNEAVLQTDAIFLHDFKALVLERIESVKESVITNK